ncbi:MULTISPECIES: tripartite tricarboxylate transporter substrate-binding protein [unclassified Bradyrhizobium]
MPTRSGRQRPRLQLSADERPSTPWDEIRLVARVVDDPSVIVVRNDSPFTTLASVLDAQRKKPGSVTFGHNGAGTNGHLAICMLAKAAGVEPNEISYRGTAAAIWSA